MSKFNAVCKCGHEIDVVFTITDISNGKYWYDESIICGIIEQDDWELYEPVRQTSAEWSEEDEDVINNLLSVCAGAKKYRQFAGCSQDDIVKYQTWLKSIKERIGG